MIISQVMNELFFNSLLLFFNADSDKPYYNEIAEFIQEDIPALVLFTKVNYGDIPVMNEFEDEQISDIARMVYIVIATNFADIFNTIVKQYDPYENYFTEREMNTESGGSNTKTGSIDTTPTGSINKDMHGSKERVYNAHTNVGQGTTFESYGDNDFKNISKNIENGSISDNFNNFGETTSFNNYKSTQTFNNVKDEVQGTEDVTENRHGSSGIFSKQELFKRELKNRFYYKLVPIFVSMCVNELITGVYYAD